MIKSSIYFGWASALSVVVFVAVGVVAVFSIPVKASANTLKVSPVRADIEVQPGTSKVVQTTVTNLTTETMVVDPVINDFVSGDERGTPALILDENDFASTRSLKRFASPLSELTVPAGETKTVNVVIAVPNGTQAGGYFGAVRFAPVAANNDSQVSVNASVASLILLKVPGDIVEKMNLTQFEIQQNNHASSYFSNADNLRAVFRFENKGGAQIGPFGKISVQKNGEVVSESDFNTKKQPDLVLPDSARQWESSLGEVGDFGRYTVSATFTYGEKNQTIEASETFWVIPKIIVIAAIIGLVTLIGGCIALVFYIRSRQQRSRGRWRRR